MDRKGSVVVLRPLMISSRFCSSRPGIRLIIQQLLPLIHAGQCVGSFVGVVRDIRFHGTYLPVLAHVCYIDIFSCVDL